MCLSMTASACATDAFSARQASVHVLPCTKPADHVASLHIAKLSSHLLCTSEKPPTSHRLHNTAPPCRALLEQLTLGQIAPFGPDQARQEALAREAWLADFHTQVIDVRGVSKGMRTGGIRRFSAVVVAGNSQVCACRLQQT